MLLEPEDKYNYQERIEKISVGNGSFHPLAFEYIQTKQHIMNMSKEQLQWYACEVLALYLNTRITIGNVDNWGKTVTEKIDIR